MYVRPKKTLAVLSYGNIIEWYDFSLYIYFSTYIAAEFFPTESRFVSYTLALATFFLGALVRPLGGLLVGWLGDRYNHLWVINVCVIVMGVSTFMVAFLPTYETIGVMAPIFLIIIRILQGFSAGGQFPGLITVAVNRFSSRQGFVVGLIYAVASLGLLLASLVGFIVNSVLPEGAGSLHWRIPFMLSGVLLVIYLWLSYKYKIEYSKSTLGNPKRENVLYALLQQWRAIVAVICLTTMAASLYFLVFTYFVNYRIESLGVSQNSAFLVNTGVLLLACILYPIFGNVADRYGYRKVFFYAAILLLILVYPLVALLKSGNEWFAILSLVGFTFFMAAIQGAISPLFASVFDKEWIAAGCAFAYSIGNALSGGAPMIAEILNHYSQMGLTMFVLGLMLLGFVGIWMLGKLKTP